MSVLCTWGWASDGTNLTESEVAEPSVVALDGSAVNLVAAGPGCTFAVTAGVNCFAWGHGTACQLGNGASVDNRAPTAISIGEMSEKIVSIASGTQHSAAVTGSGGLYTWGTGTDQLGHICESVLSSPLRVMAVSSVRIVQVPRFQYSSFAQLVCDRWRVALSIQLRSGMTGGWSAGAVAAVVS